MASCSSSCNARSRDSVSRRLSWSRWARRRWLRVRDTLFTSSSEDDDDDSASTFWTSLPSVDDPCCWVSAYTWHYTRVHSQEKMDNFYSCTLNSTMTIASQYLYDLLSLSLTNQTVEYSQNLVSTSTSTGCHILRLFATSDTMKTRRMAIANKTCVSGKN